MPPQAQGTLRLEPRGLSPTVGALRETVAACMQCGTCSGSCPSAPHMDYTPRQVMLLLQLGLEDEAIRSRAIWVRAHCDLCTIRCSWDMSVSQVKSDVSGAEEPPPVERRQDVRQLQSHTMQGGKHHGGAVNREYQL